MQGSWMQPPMSGVSPNMAFSNSQARPVSPMMMQAKSPGNEAFNSKAGDFAKANKTYSPIINATVPGQVPVLGDAKYSGVERTSRRDPAILLMPERLKSPEQGMPPQQPAAAALLASLPPGSVYVGTGAQPPMVQQQVPVMAQQEVYIDSLDSRLGSPPFQRSGMSHSPLQHTPFLSSQIPTVEPVLQTFWEKPKSPNPKSPEPGPEHASLMTKEKSKVQRSAPAPKHSPPTVGLSFACAPGAAPVIEYVHVGSPAHNAGLLEGDRILSVSATHMPTRGGGSGRSVGTDVIGLATDQFSVLLKHTFQASTMAGGRMIVEVERFGAVFFLELGPMGGEGGEGQRESFESFAPSLAGGGGGGDTRDLHDRTAVDDWHDICAVDFHRVDTEGPVAGPPERFPHGSNSRTFDQRAMTSDQLHAPRPREKEVFYPPDMDSSDDSGQVQSWFTAPEVKIDLSTSITLECLATLIPRLLRFSVGGGVPFDQPWGNQKGHLFARRVVTGNAHATEWIKITTSQVPHTQEKLILDMPLATFGTNAQSPLQIELGFLVGGGGGHQLHLKEAKLTFSQRSAAARPDVQNAEGESHFLRNGMYILGTHTHTHAHTNT